MTFSGGFAGRVIGPRVIPGAASAPPATPWYLEGGVSAANCLAAFKPKGAASLAASYSNLANPGINDAAPGSAPSFNASTGWTFNGSSQYLVIGSGAIVSGVPLSAIALFNAVNVTADCSLFSVCRTSTQLNAFDFVANGTVAGDPISAYTDSGGSYPRASSSSGYSAGSWFVGAVVWAAINSRAAYIGGGSKGTNTTSVTPSSLDTTFIACAHNSSARVEYFNGSIAALAVYDIALSDPQVLAISTAMAAL